MKRRRSIRTTVGMAPGSLIYTGQEAASTQVTLWSYNDRDLQRIDGSLGQVELSDDHVVWIEIRGLGDTEKLSELSRRLGIPSLMMEDALNASHLPKVELDSHCLIAIGRELSLQEAQVENRQVALILGRGWLLSMQEKPSQLFDSVKTRLQQGGARLRASGADMLCYALLDVLVDSYFPLLEQLSDETLRLEDRLLADDHSVTAEDLYLLRNCINDTRRSVAPLREAVNGLQRADENHLLDTLSRSYLRDLYDHVLHLVSQLEDQRENRAALLDLYLNSQSNRMNQSMQFLTVVATIFIPLTFIVGIYGMNFQSMPELSWSWGYPAVMAFMGVLAIGMVAWFRRRGWL